MAVFNEVTLVGNLVRDPELRYTPGGKAVCDIDLAINRKRDGQDNTTFINGITLWNKTAENVCNYCTKGAMLLIKGELSVNEWEDKESGSKRTKMKVVGFNVQFLGGKPKHKEQPPIDYVNNQQNPYQQQSAPPTETGDGANATTMQSARGQSRQAAIAEMKPTVQRRGNRCRMGDKKQRCLALRDQIQHQLHHRIASGLIQTASGFIRKQETGAQRQRAGDGHPLLLPARQLLWIARQERRQSQPLAQQVLPIRIIAFRQLGLKRDIGRYSE